MKKIIICIIITILIILAGYIILSSVDNDIKPNQEENISGKDISKEEYIYKEDLLELGYSLNDITSIENKIPSLDVKKYLLTKKYDNLISFLSSPYFKAQNIERYEEYHKKKNDYSYDEVVLYVEIGLDNEFYTNIKTITNPYDVTTLINKYNQLDKSVQFDDLVTIKLPYSKDGKRSIRKVAYDNLIKMIDDAKKDNITLKVVSGYRTWDQQTGLFNNSKNKNGLDYALMYSAKPGHSEHQLGLAVDLNTTQNGFEKTKEYAWLKQNAYKYGFIERYPKGKEFITGYAFEPWHYRYLGDISTKIFEENITYEEYLVKYNVPTTE